MDDSSDKAVDLHCAREVAQHPDHIAAGQPARSDSGRGRDDGGSASHIAVVSVCQHRGNVTQTRRQGIGQGQFLINAIQVGQQGRESEDDQAADSVGLNRRPLAKLLQKRDISHIVTGGISTAHSADSTGLNAVGLDAAGRHSCCNLGCPSSAVGGDGCGQHPGDDVAGDGRVLAAGANRRAPIAKARADDISYDNAWRFTVAGVAHGDRPGDHLACVGHLGSRCLLHLQRRSSHRDAGAGSGGVRTGGDAGGSVIVQHVHHVVPTDRYLATPAGTAIAHTEDQSSHAGGQSDGSPGPDGGVVSRSGVSAGSSAGINGLTVDKAGR